MKNEISNDKVAIREVVENWVLWRDSGNWDAFAGVWHTGAQMVATWHQSSASDFIAACKAGWEGGVEILHLLSGSTIEVRGKHAVAQTKMTICQRAKIHDQLVDVTCMGRFYDLFEYREDRWAIVLRQPIYERDRLDLVDPSATMVLDGTLLAQFPAGYRHLAYVQTLLGLKVHTDMPGTRGPEVDDLYERGLTWLNEGSLRPARGATA